VRLRRLIYCRHTSCVPRPHFCFCSQSVRPLPPHSHARRSIVAEAGVLRGNGRLARLGILLVILCRFDVPSFRSTGRSRRRMGRGPRRRLFPPQHDVRVRSKRAAARSSSTEAEASTIRIVRSHLERSPGRRTRWRRRQSPRPVRGLWILGLRSARRCPRVGLRVSAGNRSIAGPDTHQLPNHDAAATWAHVEAQFKLGRVD
jgi:hypothetical protein